MTLHDTLPARLSGNRYLNVRFAPISYRNADIPVRQLCARSGLVDELFAMTGFHQLRQEVPEDVDTSSSQ